MICVDFSVNFQQISMKFRKLLRVQGTPRVSFQVPNFPELQVPGTSSSRKFK